MLPKPFRLRTMRAFRLLRKRSRTAGNRFLFLRYRKTGKNTAARIAIVVSKKTEKRAVKRNRARRQLREILRPLLPFLAEGVDLSISIKSSFLELSFEEKKKATEDVLKRAKLFKKQPIQR